jgi:hypothetical protein
MTVEQRPAPIKIAQLNSHQPPLFATLIVVAIFIASCRRLHLQSLHIIVSTLPSRGSLPAVRIQHGYSTSLAMSSGSHGHKFRS